MLATEPIGSIPRPQQLLDAVQAQTEGRITETELDAVYDDAVRETITAFEETGSPVVTDGEQRKPSFATYPIAGLKALAPDGLLNDFVALNNRVLARFSPGERGRLGVHTCPGGDQDSTHSADVDYADLLPSLFQLEVGSFYLQLASESEPGRACWSSSPVSFDRGRRCSSE